MARRNPNKIAYVTNLLFAEKNRKSLENSSEEKSQNSSFLQLGRRTYWSPEAIQEMKDLYEQTSCPSKNDMQALADKFNCDISKIFNWFKNHRQMHRRKNIVPESKFQKDSAKSGGRVWFSKQVKEELLKHFNENPYLTKEDAVKCAEKWNLPERKIENWFKNQRQKMRREGVSLKYLARHDGLKYETFPNQKASPTKSVLEPDSPGNQSTEQQSMEQQSTEQKSSEIPPEPSVKHSTQTTSSRVDSESLTLSQCESNSAEQYPDEEIDVEDLGDENNEDSDEDIPLSDLVIKQEQRSCIVQQKSRVSSLEETLPIQQQQPIKYEQTLKNGPLDHYVKVFQPMLAQQRLHEFTNQSIQNPQFQQFMNPNFLQFCSIYQKYCHFLAAQSATSFH